MASDDDIQYVNIVGASIGKVVNVHQLFTNHCCVLGNYVFRCLGRNPAGKTTLECLHALQGADGRYKTNQRIPLEDVMLPVTYMGDMAAARGFIALDVQDRQAKGK